MVKYFLHAHASDGGGIIGHQPITVTRKKNYDRKV